MIASSIGRLLGGLFGFGLICVACGGTLTTTSGSPTACEPGTVRCDGDDAKRCDRTGADESIELTCSSGQCRVRDNQAFCDAPPTGTACTANQAVCAGSVATTCKADGSGPEPGGVDCAATRQRCAQGSCSGSQCVAGAKSCQNGDVYLCAPDGSGLSVFAHCSEGELCDDNTGSCVPQLCEPGKDTCSGTRVLTCNDDGSGWLSATTDCATQGKVCRAGSCGPKICTASTTFCQDGNLYQCDPTGASSALSQTCRPGLEHCEVTPAGLYAFCVTNACIAGEQLCVGDVIKTCNADGSLPAEGIACAKDEFCENAQCIPLGCEPGTLLCKDNDVYSCGPSGASLYLECEAGQACLDIVPNSEQGSEVYPALTSCVPASCPAGATGCVLNKIGTCAADGVSLSGVTADCAANGQVCTSTGTCAASVSETLGLDQTAEAISGEPYVGDVIDVHSPRKLTELQVWLAFPSPRDLHWIVYEQVGAEFISRVEKTTSVASSAGFVSSGSLGFDYQLEAGKRYALGLIVPSGSVGYTSSWPPVTDKASFGSVLGSVRAYDDFSSFSVAGGFIAQTTSYMKVTTESP